MKLCHQWIFPIKLTVILLPVILFAGMSSNLLSVIYAESTSQYLANKYILNLGRYCWGLVSSDMLMNSLLAAGALSVWFCIHIHFY